MGHWALTRHGPLTTRGRPQSLRHWALTQPRARAQAWRSLFVASCTSLYLPGCPQPPMAMPWQSPAGQWSSWLIGLQRDKHGLARRSMRERMVAWGQSPTDGVDRVKPGRANAGGWLDRGPSLHGSYRLACSVLENGRKDHRLSWRVTKQKLCLQLTEMRKTTCWISIGKSSR